MEQERAGTYANPGAVEIGLIEAGDDLLDEILGGAEAAALAQKQRGFLIVDPGIDVKDRLQVAVNPVVSRHFCSSSVSSLPTQGNCGRKIAAGVGACV